MRSIVRHDTGESYQQFLTRLAKESGRRLGQSARTRCEDHELQGSGSRPSRMQRKRDGAAALGPHSRYRREPALSIWPRHFAFACRKLIHVTVSDFGSKIQEAKKNLQ